MKKLFNFCLIIVLLLFLAGCGSDSGSGKSDTDTKDTASVDSTGYTASVSGTASTYNAADLVANTTFSDTVEINLTDKTVKLSTGTAYQDFSSSSITIMTGLTVAVTTYGVTITSTVSSAVKYSLTGTLSGTLTVNSTSAYQLYLNGVTINGSSGPALDLESSAKVFIVLADGTVNTLTDISTRSGMTMKAALYGKGVMVFGGTGTLSVSGNYKHGIFCNDYIRICGGTLNVSVTVKNAIQSVNGFIFDDGTLTIKATGTTIDDESKGIKVEGSESTGTGKGYVVINGGTITITSVSKGITAAWDIDEDVTTTATTDDPSPYVIINSGVITITTTGTPYEYTSGGTTVSCSPEGIEGKTNLTVNSGYIIINTSDDCLNAGTSIAINGGYIYCKSTSNDSIDSNGTITINGGVVVAIGSSAPEGAFDCDTNTFAVTGGTFIGIGGTVSRPTASACTQNVVILGSLTSGTTMALVSSDGAEVFAYTIPQTYSTMILSSPDITTGIKYKIYTKGSASADALFNGLYLGSISYDDGSSSSSITISSRLTQSGGTIFE